MDDRPGAAAAAAAKAAAAFTPVLSMSSLTIPCDAGPSCEATVTVVCSDGSGFPGSDTIPKTSDDTDSSAAKNDGSSVAVVCPDCRAAYYCSDQCLAHHRSEHEAFCRRTMAKEWANIPVLPGLGSDEGSTGIGRGAMISIPSNLNLPTPSSGTALDGGTDSAAAVAASAKGTVATTTSECSSVSVCSICLDDPQSKTAPVVTLEACQHVFCLPCLVQWKRHSTNACNTNGQDESKVPPHSDQRNPWTIPSVLADVEPSNLVCPTCRTVSNDPEDYLLLMASNACERGQHAACPSAALKAQLLKEAFMIASALLQVPDPELQPLLVLAKVLLALNRPKDCIATTRKLMKLDQERHAVVSSDSVLAWVEQGSRSQNQRQNQNLNAHGTAAAVGTVADTDAPGTGAPTGNMDLASFALHRASQLTVMRLRQEQQLQHQLQQQQLQQQLNRGDGNTGAHDTNTNTVGTNTMTSTLPSSATSLFPPPLPLPPLLMPVVVAHPERAELYQDIYLLQGEAFVQLSKWSDALRIYRILLMAQASSSATATTNPPTLPTPGESVSTSGSSNTATAVGTTSSSSSRTTNSIPLNVAYTDIPNTEHDRNQAERHDPQQSAVLGQVYKGLAICHYELGEYETALQMANQAILMDRSMPGVHRCKTLCLLQRSKQQQEQSTTEAAAPDSSCGSRRDQLLQEAMSIMNHGVLYEAPWDPSTRVANLALYHSLPHMI